MSTVRGRWRTLDSGDRWRVAGELVAILGAVVLARFEARLSPAGVVLAAVATLAVVVVARLWPGTDNPSWPALAARERGGRRSEVYRLSWRLGMDRDSATVAAERLGDAVSDLVASTPPVQRQVLDQLAARLGEPLDRRGLAHVVDDLERAVAAFEETSPIPRIPRSTP